MHHVTPELLAWAFHQLKARAAPGVDGVTWEEYAGALDANIGGATQWGQTMTDYVSSRAARVCRSAGLR